MLRVCKLTASRTSLVKESRGGGGHFVGCARVPDERLLSVGLGSGSRSPSPFVFTIYEQICWAHGPGMTNSSGGEPEVSIEYKV